MNAKNVTTEQLQAAARTVGVRLCNLRPAGKTPRAGLAFTIATVNATRASGTAITGSAKYRRLSRHNGRTIPGAVCWHGHRDFFRAMYALAPTAVVKTALATYSGAAHFEASHGATYGEPAPYMGMQVWPSRECACEVQP